MVNELALASVPAAVTVTGTATAVVASSVISRRARRVVGRMMIPHTCELTVPATLRPRPHGGKRGNPHALTASSYPAAMPGAVFGREAELGVLDGFLAAL